MSNLHDAEIAFNRASDNVKRFEGKKNSSPDDYNYWLKLKKIAEINFNVEVDDYLGVCSKKLDTKRF